MRVLLALFLVGHAAVHAVMWTLPFTDAADEMPFDPGRSWLFGEARGWGLALAALAALAFTVSALGYLLHAGWWPPAMLAAGAVSLTLMVLWFSPWWSVGMALSAALAVYAWQIQLAA